MGEKLNNKWGFGKLVEKCSTNCVTKQIVTKLHGIELEKHYFRINS